MKKGAAISVVIPSAGRSVRLDRCVEALARQDLEPYEIIIVSPDDQVVHTLGSWQLNGTVVCNAPSTLFSQSINMGITRTQGQWVLVLNDDVILEPSFLGTLMDGFSGNERIGMVCGKLLSADGRTIDSTGQFVSRSRTAVERGHRSLDRGQFNTNGCVFSVPGAAALYRRTMLEEIKEGGTRYFDERMGMYLEDLDLGWRAQRAGWQAYYVHNACAIHERGASAKTRTSRWKWLNRYYLPRLRPEFQLRYILNRYRLILKHDSITSFLINAPWIAWYELKLWFYLLCMEPVTMRLVWKSLRTHA